MRKLLCCPSCNRQFDATRLTVGSRFRCRCGAAIDVPVIDSRDAVVVRCTSCGAAREEGSTACGYCGSDFTLHEQDLETTCPSCLARISNTARFCHHCGTAIAPEDVAADPTDRLCPECGDGRFLSSRPLGDTKLTVMECQVCAGLWLGSEVFRTLEDRARKLAPPTPDPVALRTEAKTRRRSGDHGIWFDATELDGVLRWIKLGGERLSDERREQEERARASHLRFKVEPKAPEDARRAVLTPAEVDSGFDAIPTIVNWLLKL
jgi:DNA-directed RNA polymerase subunit RPC12/RpoP